MAAAGAGEFAIIAIAIGKNEELSVRNPLNQCRERLPDHVPGVAGPETGVECRARDLLSPVRSQEKQLNVGDSGQRR